MMKLTRARPIIANTMITIKRAWLFRDNALDEGADEGELVVGDDVMGILTVESIA